MKYDAAALGELLIDFTGDGRSARGNPVFEANPGGAPGNVLAMLAKLGKKTAFIGKVGADMFGDMLLAALEKAGIDAQNVLRDEKARTALAFIRNLDGGEREFSFLRDGSADTRLSAQDISADVIESCRVFHFGSLSLTHEPARGATVAAVRRARRAGALISFDPNLRKMLWRDLVEAREQMLRGCGECDILKVSDDELEFITRERDESAAVDWIKRRFPQIRLLLVTRGARGAALHYGGISLEQRAFLSENTVDTTGAGDIFLGCCLSFVLEHGLDSLSPDTLGQMLRFACAAASLITERKGALLCAPERHEIERLLAK